MRADSFAGRLIAALARTDFDASPAAEWGVPAPAPAVPTSSSDFDASPAAGWGVPHGSWVGRLIAALARTAPDDALVRHARDAGQRHTGR